MAHNNGSAKPQVSVSDTNYANPVVPGSIASIAEKVSPSVVKIEATGATESGTGTGFVLTEDGYILTNNHVASVGDGQGGSLTVVFSDGTKEKATLVGASQQYDLAVLKVNKTGLTKVEIGDSSKVHVGDTAIAFGSPLGLEGTVTSGIISALNRPVTTGGDTGAPSYIDAIQTDAPINPGNSGGPLVNAAGQVIGINSAIASLGAATGQQSGSIGLGFAIPIDTASRVANEIIKTGSAQTPVIGVSIDSQYTGDGAKVSSVTTGGAAEKAGIKVGDVVTQVNDTRITDGTGLIVAVRNEAPGDKVTVKALALTGRSENHELGTVKR